LVVLPVAYWLYLATSLALASDPDWFGVAGTLVLSAIFVGLGLGLRSGSRAALLVAVCIGLAGIFSTQGFAAFRIAAACYGAALLFALWSSRRFFGKEPGRA
jgi:hypothetical protein